ncbi:Protein of unknown function DUF974 [Trinorchestia longiramus]|nr:Protein of unknown function DUF974 [Trinorchestia longiramus]
MEVKDKEHPLTLKVMRLTRPSLFSSISVTCDARDLPADLLNADLRQDVAIPGGLPYTGIGQVLLLPQSFGNIYLGETFSCCLCVHNNSSSAIQQVYIKAVLQISTERVDLLGTDTDEPQTLLPNAVTSSLIQHEVKDVGTHILVCAVSYVSLAGEPQNFRKFYKFQVMKPIDIRTRFMSAQLSDDILVEAGVENITSGPICLEKVSLEPSPLYDVVAIDSLYPSVCNTSVDSSIPGCPSLFGPINVLNPHDTRQYLYCLTPKSNRSSDAGAPSTVGKLDIVWRTNMGDRGRLQTSQFVHTPSGSPPADVVVKVTQAPSSATLEESVSVTLSFFNTSERALQFRLEFLSGAASESGCEWHDAVSRTLPILAARQTHLLTAVFVPLRLGIQNICGVRLRDLSNPTYIMDVTKFGQVLVVDRPPDELHAVTGMIDQLTVC